MAQLENTEPIELEVQECKTFMEDSVFEPVRRAINKPIQGA